VKRPLTVVVLAAVAVLAACGVPTEQSPQALPAKNVPFQLLAPTAEATSTTVLSTSKATTRISIYLANADGELVPTRRQVEAPATIGKAVGTLLRGPTEEEANMWHTAITSDTKLLHAEPPVDGLVTIDLSRQLLDITGRQQILALAQVVYTATALADVDRVLFRFDGKPKEVPNGDGKLTASPLGRLSYRGLVGTD
jgi:spore germination protein GerM